MTTPDNQLPILTTGASNWDSDLDAAMQIIERGYHVTAQAGIAVNTGNVLWQNSGGFFFPFDPNSTAIFPAAMAFTAANSGDSVQLLLRGIVRSLAINSPAVPGLPIYVSILTPGLIVATNSGTNRKAGYGLPGYGVLFNPANVFDGVATSYVPTFSVQSSQIAAVVGSVHTFTMSLGANQGWNRRVRINAASATHVEIKFFADAARTDLQYQTASGGVTGVGSFNDRAGWPLDSNSGTIYGSCQVFSWDVTTDTINIQGHWEV
jgi:hypothetical protein